MELYTYDYDLKLFLDRLPKFKLSETNKKLMLKYLEYMKNERLSTARIMKLLTTMKLICQALGKDLDKVDKADAERFCNEINNRPISERSKGDYKATYKQLRKWITGNVDFPEDVRWIQRKKLMDMRKLNTKTPDDLLTEDEKKAIIHACSNARDKAMFSVLIEAGLRPRELLSLRITHFKFEDNITMLSVPQDTKTGQRFVPIVASKRYLLDWLSIHPERNNKNAPMWSLLKRKAGREEDALTYVGFQELIRYIKQRTGIKKRFHSYLFRHSSYTEKANSGWSEQEIKAYHGLEPNSKVLSAYIHMTGRELIDRVRAHNGLQAAPARRLAAIHTVICPTCSMESPTSEIQCRQCGQVLDLREAQKVVDAKEKETKKIEVMAERLERMELILFKTLAGLGKEDAALQLTPDMKERLKQLMG